MPATIEGGAEERLKSALWYAVGQIVDEESLRLNTNASPQFIGALTELVWSQIATAGRDVEDFARHANRSTVTAADVVLLGRRNDGLEGLLKQHLEMLERTHTTKAKGKKTKR